VRERCYRDPLARHSPPHRRERLCASPQRLEARLGYRLQLSVGVPCPPAHAPAMRSTHPVVRALEETWPRHASRFASYLIFRKRVSASSSSSALSMLLFIDSMKKKKRGRRIEKNWTCVSLVLQEPAFAVSLVLQGLCRSCYRNPLSRSSEREPIVPHHWRLFPFPRHGHDPPTLELPQRPRFGPALNSVLRQHLVR
jgi:hypothetical protein